MPRVPLAANDLQVNHCRNPCCENFGVPARTEAVPRGRRRKGQNAPADVYRIHGLEKFMPGLLCRGCGKVVAVKSNQAIADEMNRLGAYLGSANGATCPNAACANHNSGMTARPERYQRFGTTRAGTPRFRCRDCRRVFVPQRRSRRQLKPHENKTVFRALVSKAPVRSIAYQADLSTRTVYDKIDFIHRQCLAFAAGRERRLPDLAVSRLWLGVDRQDYIVNWSDRADKRNVQLSAIATVDNLTGYCFGAHVNFDPGADRDVIEQEAIAAGDYDGRGYPFRRHARYWLKQDLAASQVRQVAQDGRRAALARRVRSVAGGDPLVGAVEAALLEQAAAADAEWSEEGHPRRKLPDRGMQVRSDYTMYAHFELLRRQLKSAGRIRFCLDLDSGMRNACLAIFRREIKERRVDVFDVRVLKGMTIDFRRRAVRQTRTRLKAYQARLPGTPLEVLRALAVSWCLHHAVIEAGPQRERWIVHPLPDMAEPGKALHLSTDFGDYDPLHLARLHDRASLHRVDNFFQQVRRKLNLLERPIATASSTWKVWRGYSPYNPATIGKLLDIYRVYYNFVKPEEPRTDTNGIPLERRTPAMRLGLAKGPIRIEDILYFDPSAPERDGRDRNAHARPKRATVMNSSTSHRRPYRQAEPRSPAVPAASF